MTDAERFHERPHGTLLALSIPVLFSLIAEPLTGLVDTAFVARLGSVSLAALGVGTMSLSAVFWIFNFLGIGTQTEVAQSLGAGEHDRASHAAGLAMSLAMLIGLGLLILGVWLAPLASRWMGASGAIESGAVLYIRIRLLAAPAVLVTVAGFGALRGIHDMQTPLKIAVAVNVFNIALDWPLIFGLGPIPRLEIAGAAAASALSQWIGATWVFVAVRKKIGTSRPFDLTGTRKLLRVGGDLFLRTGLLTAFLVLTTRAATRIGAEAGAAHQAIRQVWQFTALFLDAFAVAGQSLIGWFVGGARTAEAKRVAAVVLFWSVVTGAGLGLLMILGQPIFEKLLVPAGALPFFATAWWIAALSQPLNGISFGTDGIHWGTGDFAFLRNVVGFATAVGAIGIWALDERGRHAFAMVWILTALWITIRALFGVLRIWPGIGKAPLAD
ncbi:MAG: MATE family efflux transporter [Thermoanaerobaculia bacterium]|nr:MATE family efflux transporter [Thermoanaerobaculia bacterium]